ncbi:MULTISPECIES: hypothetical protein [Bacteroidales]|uniref:hypothetical protein n=1 Tax=Bacteroidales TaxID=171549 RepID=UPI00266F04CE|nr:MULTISPECIES: hypothetical protein [Bacteroidales]
MREKIMNIKDLENALSDETTIDEMLGNADVLRIDELHSSYERDEDIRLNRDFQDYKTTREEEWRQKEWKNR